MSFENRPAAGRQLASALAHYAGTNVVVLGVACGGVVVAREVAAALHAPLDVIVARRIGVPTQPEMTVGAVGEGGVSIRRPDAMRTAGMSDDQFVAAELHALGEIERRCQRFRGERPLTDLRGKVVIIVDDGISTGCTASAAVAVAREHHAEHIVVATPVSTVTADQDLQRQADDVVVLQVSQDLLAIRYWYDNFAACTDDDVVRLLAGAAATPDALPVGAVGDRRCEA